MQLRLLLLLLGPLLAIELQAQRPSRSGYGLKGGPQAATWRSAVMNYRPVPGIAVGAYAPFWICPTLEVQPELLFSVQGTSMPVPESGRRQLRTGYVQVPLTLKLFLDRKFSVQGGYQGGYLLAAVADGEDVRSDLHPVDHGFLVGVGMDPRHGFDLTLRYYSGFNEVLQEDDEIYPTTRVLQFTLGKRLGQFSQRRIRRH